MKTPQEEARQLAESIHPIWAMEDENRTFDEIVLATIPLVELIAVARAADELWQITRPSKYDFERVKLRDALQALRATGKVTL